MRLDPKTPFVALAAAFLAGAILLGLIGGTTALLDAQQEVAR